MNHIAQHIASLAFASVILLPTKAQDNQPQTLLPGEQPKPTKYVAIEEENAHIVFFQGFTLSVDAFGPISYIVSDYGTAEAALRLNLKNTYFPIVEMGYGKCSTEDFNTKVSYKVNAPYVRIGFDINMLKDKFQSNRLYLGARYAFSTYEYDIAGPPMTDPIWGGTGAFSISGTSCTSHWLEVLMGVEVKIYKNFHMGWAVRYKRELASTKNDYSKPDCIPGYGYTTNSTCWGGTYSLIFDLNWGMKKSHKRRVNVEIREKTTTLQPLEQTIDIETEQNDVYRRESTNGNQTE
jgi:hypothetical protein